jgi:hypothetical protein
MLLDFEMHFTPVSVVLETASAGLQLIHRRQQVMVASEALFSKGSA